MNEASSSLQGRLSMLFMSFSPTHREVLGPNGSSIIFVNKKGKKERREGGRNLGKGWKDKKLVLLVIMISKTY